MLSWTHGQEGLGSGTAQFKPWPNECNVAIHHRSTLLNATCWTRLATMLHHVVWCCMMLNEVWFPSNILCNIIVQHFCTHALQKSSLSQGQREVWPKIWDHYSSQIFDFHNSGPHRTCCIRLVMQYNAIQQSGIRQCWMILHSFGQGFIN